MKQAGSWSHDISGSILIEDALEQVDAIEAQGEDNQGMTHKNRS